MSRLQLTDCHSKFNALSGILSVYFSNDLQKRLIFIRTALAGASKLMPFLPGKPVKQFATEPAGLYVETIFMPKNARVLTSTNGQNLRLAIYERVRSLADYVLSNRTDDTKSMFEIISILRILLLVRGIDDKTLNPLINAYRINKMNLIDPVRGSSANIEPVVEDSLVFMHLVSILRLFLLSRARPCFFGQLEVFWHSKLEKLDASIFECWSLNLLHSAQDAIK